MCVNLDPVTARSLTCPLQRCLGTPLPGLLCREEERHLPTFHICLWTLSLLQWQLVYKKTFLHSVPHTATYKKELSFSLLPHQLSFSLPSLSFSAGTCNYLMPGRQVLSRGVRPGASWQLEMIRRILEFCHWSQRCSPQRLGCLVVTATIAALNLLTGEIHQGLGGSETLNNRPSGG